MVHGTTVARDESITVYASSRWKPLTPRGSKRLLMGFARRLSQQMWYNCACYMVWVFCVGFTMFTQSDSAKKSYDSFILHGLTFYEMSWLVLRTLFDSSIFVGLRGAGGLDHSYALPNKFVCWKQFSWFFVACVSLQAAIGHLSIPSPSAWVSFVSWSLAWEPRSRRERCWDVKLLNTSHPFITVKPF